MLRAQLLTGFWVRGDCVGFAQEANEEAARIAAAFDEAVDIGLYRALTDLMGVTPYITGYLQGSWHRSSGNSEEDANEGVSFDKTQAIHWVFNVAEYAEFVSEGANGAKAHKFDEQFQDFAEEWLNFEFSRLL